MRRTFAPSFSADETDNLSRRRSPGGEVEQHEMA